MIARGSLLVLLLAACGRWSDTEPVSAVSVYTVDILNEATVSAKVIDSAHNGFARAYGGETRTLTLRYTSGQRFLVVEVGSYRFKTPEFWPNETAPCWYLIVKQPPRLPQGPWPYTGDCP